MTLTGQTLLDGAEGMIASAIIPFVSPAAASRGGQLPTEEDYFDGTAIDHGVEYRRAGSVARRSRSPLRIHGTLEPWTIGSDVSSGCIRLLPEDLIDLYDRVPTDYTSVCDEASRLA